MKKNILIILLVLTVFAGYAQAQKTPPEGYNPDKVAVFSFVVGDDVFMLGLNHNDRIFKEVMDFIDANKEHINDGSMPIFVYGYCAKGGSETTRAARAKRMSNYVKGELIRLNKAKERNFVTLNSLNCYSETLANAVVVKFYMPFNYETRQPKFIDKPNLVPELLKADDSKKEPVTTPVSDSLKAEVVVQQSKQEVAAAEPTQAETPIEKTEKEYNSSRWYVGVGGGVSFGRGTFCSFAADKTRPGFNVGVLGGYKINKLLSAELSLDYTRMALGAYDCCQNLYLGADGNRYFAPVTGVPSYRYGDVLSTTNLIGLGAHLNIDLVSIWNNNSRWSALASPAIYGVFSSATIKQGSTQVHTENRFHFGLGADVGVGYKLTDCLGLRLSTGINYLVGSSIDALPKEEHKSNYVWNTVLKIIYKW